MDFLKQGKKTMAFISAFEESSLPDSNYSIPSARTLKYLIPGNRVINSGEQIIVRLYINKRVSTVNEITSMYIGHQEDPPGNWWHFDGTQIQLFWQGNDTIPSSELNSEDLDDVVYELDIADYSIQAGKALVFSCYHNTGYYMSFGGIAGAMTGSEWASHDTITEDIAAINTGFVPYSGDRHSDDVCAIFEILIPSSNRVLLSVFSVPANFFSLSFLASLGRFLKGFTHNVSMLELRDKILSIQGIDRQIEFVLSNGLGLALLCYLKHPYIMSRKLALHETLTVANKVVCSLVCDYLRGDLITTKTSLTNKTIDDFFVYLQLQNKVSVDTKKALSVVCEYMLGNAKNLLLSLNNVVINKELGQLISLSDNITQGKNKLCFLTNQIVNSLCFINLALSNSILSDQKFLISVPNSLGDAKQVKISWNELISDVAKQVKLSLNNEVELKEIYKKLVSILTQMDVSVPEIPSIPSIDPETGEPIIDPETGEPVKILLYQTWTLYLDNKKINHLVSGNIVLKQERDQVHDYLEFESMDKSLYLLANPEKNKDIARVCLQIGQREINFFLTERSISGESKAKFKCLSESYKQDTEKIDITLDYLANAKDFCGSLLSCDLDWDIVDFTIPEGISFSGTPIEIIQEVISDLGIVRNQEDGALLVRPKNTVRPIEINTTNPIYNYDRSKVVGIEGDLLEQKEFNEVDVYPADEENADLSPIFEVQDPEDGELVIGDRVDIRVFWGGNFADRMSFDATSGFVARKKSNRKVRLTEKVTFNKGEASVSKPIYDIVRVKWMGQHWPIYKTPGFEPYSKSLTLEDDNGFGIAEIIYDTYFDEYSVFYSKLEEILVWFKYGNYEKPPVTVTRMEGGKKADDIRMKYARNQAALVYAGKMFLDEHYRFVKEISLKKCPYNGEVREGNIVFLENEKLILGQESLNENCLITSLTTTITGPAIWQDIRVKSWKR